MITSEIQESDWKVFRQLQPVALNRFCESILTEIEQISSDEAKSPHERYLEVFKLMGDRDKELGWAFDGMRRSRAFTQIAMIRSLGVLTEEEIERFSPEAQQKLEVFISD